MKNLHKNFVFDLIVAVLALALAIVMLPPIGIGQQALNILLAVALVLYLALYLFERMVHARGTIFVLTLVEFSVIALIALGLILQQFKVFQISGVCRTLGLVIWLRGVIGLVRGYLVGTPRQRRRFSMLLFFGYIALVTLGTYCFAAPFISDVTLNWIFCIGFFLLFALFLVFALLVLPSKKKTQA